MKAPDIEHPEIGRLRHDPRMKCFEGHLRLGDLDVFLYIDADADGDCGLGLERAAAIAKDLAGYDARVKSHTCRTCIEARNADWSEPGEGPLSAEEYMRRMTLETVNIYKNGSAQFIYQDGGLYWGHAILIDMQAEGSFEDPFLGA